MAYETSIGDWSKSMGMSRQAGHQAIKRCGIPVQDGKVDALVATTLYQARTRIRMKAPRDDAPRAQPESGAAGEDAKPSVKSESDAHDARRKKAEADKAELEALRMAGNLVPREAAERIVFEAFRTLRDAVFAANRGAAPMVVGLAEVREIQHQLDEASRSAFAGWEEGMQARLQELARP